MTVATDDPVAYVKALEPDSALEVSEVDGSTIVQADHNGFWIRYEFTEETSSRLVAARRGKKGRL